ncbi:MAG TPA: uroporphyrinogen-III synthase [Gammaproteobacteria bacterium]
MIPSGDALRGITVLVTRPAHQSQHIIELLESTGAASFAFPSIEIAAISPDQALIQRLDELPKYRMIIFISANAVEYGLNFIKKSSKSIDHAAIVAIGNSTAKALQKHHIPVAIQPDQNFTSEALLQMPDMQAEQIAGHDILIVRGTGGRPYLAETLRSRGSRVDYMEVYQRRRPESDTRALIDLWAAGGIHVVTVTSNEALKNLYDMLDKKGQEYLLNTVLIVPGQRCADLATQLGFRNSIEIAASATDEDMLDAIVKWHKPDYS